MRLAYESRILSNVKYGKFLETCRELAGFDNKSEFARSLKHPVDEAYYINKEAGLGEPPGRKLLEDAAQLAGTSLEDCLQPPQRLTKNEKYLQIFRDALNDWRALDAVNAALSLSQLQRPKRKKYGGRGRKNA